MKQKRLTKKQKQELLTTISNNNLEGDSIKNFVRAKGFSAKQAEKVYEEYCTTKEDKNLQTLWAEELKNEKYQLDTILDEDFTALIEEVDSTKKILSPTEVKNKLIAFGYNPAIVTEFIEQYQIALEKLRAGEFGIELNDNLKKQLFDLNLSDQPKTSELSFPDLPKKRLQTFCLVKSFPYLEWVGESDTESVLCRWDGNFWYFGAHPVPNRINLQQWKYGSSNVVGFLNEMGYLPPEDYIEVDL